MTDDTRKPALITGASRGLGAALALALAPTHHIIAVGRTTGALEELDDRIQAAGGQATLAPMDVTDKGAMAHLCRSVHDRWGGVSIWAHTAIYGPALMPTTDLDDKGWNQAWNTNVEATRNLILMVNALMDDGSTALFFADDQAGEKFFAGYGATKAAQVAMVKSWAAENARIGPRVIVAEPRPLATVMRTRFFPGEDRGQLASADAEAARILKEAGLI
ncbi:SDR family oxidoreductase [Aliiroseovarius sp.]|uniref:SDR family NAD(P)-dependent oxidoreductase n=1 Tax=Aliiroseovarius sp. TaxID=1872442 RepID=UPI0026312B5E|nr:SDR family oxidoreductase [Aliiroseovarius sp.]